MTRATQWLAACGLAFIAGVVADPDVHLSEPGRAAVTALACWVVCAPLVVGSVRGLLLLPLRPRGAQLDAAGALRNTPQTPAAATASQANADPAATGSPAR